MELHHSDPTCVLFPHDGIGQSFRDKCLSDAGGTLQNHIEFCFQQICECIVFSLIHEDFIEKVVFRIGRILDFSRSRHLFLRILVEYLEQLLHKFWIGCDASECF